MLASQASARCTGFYVDVCCFCAAAGGAGGYESDEMEIEDEDGEAGYVNLKQPN